MEHPFHQTNWAGSWKTDGYTERTQTRRCHCRGSPITRTSNVNFYFFCTSETWSWNLIMKNLKKFPLHIFWLYLEKKLPPVAQARNSKYGFAIFWPESRFQTMKILKNHEDIKMKSTLAFNRMNFINVKCNENGLLKMHETLFAHYNFLTCLQL